MRALRSLLAALAVVAALGAGAAMLLRDRQGSSPAAAPETPADGRGLADLAAALVEGSAEGYDRPAGPWRLDLPADHGAHPGARAESWTIVAHLTTAQGVAVGAQFALLRLGLRPPDAPAPETAWALRGLHRAHVALSVADAERPLSEERFSRGALGVAGDDAARQEIWLDDWTLRHGLDGGGLALEASLHDARIALRLAPGKPAVALGGGDAPFRGYALTRLAVEGVIELDDGPQAVNGQAWLDHAWGDLPLPGGPIVWDRLQIQLDDGSDLSILRSRRRGADAAASTSGLLVRPDGRAETLAEGALSMEPTTTWRGADGAAWPVGWRVAGAGLELEIEPLISDQTHAFAERLWTGPVSARGAVDGAAARGSGTLTLTGYGSR